MSQLIHNWALWDDVFEAYKWIRGESLLKHKNVAISAEALKLLEAPFAFGCSLSHRGVEELHREAGRRCRRGGACNHWFLRPSPLVEDGEEAAPHEA